MRCPKCNGQGTVPFSRSAGGGAMIVCDRCAGTCAVDDPHVLTLGELRARLDLLAATGASDSLPVYLEGCDCYGEMADVALLPPGNDVAHDKPCVALQRTGV